MPETSELDLTTPPSLNSSLPAGIKSFTKLREFIELERKALQATMESNKRTREAIESRFEQFTNERSELFQKSLDAGAALESAEEIHNLALERESRLRMIQESIDSQIQDLAEQREALEAEKEEIKTERIAIQSDRLQLQSERALFEAEKIAGTMNSLSEECQIEESLHEEPVSNDSEEIVVDLVQREKLKEEIRKEVESELKNREYLLQQKVRAHAAEVKIFEQRLESFMSEKQDIIMQRDRLEEDRRLFEIERDTLTREKAKVAIIEKRLDECEEKEKRLQAEQEQFRIEKAQFEEYKTEQEELLANKTDSQKAIEHEREFLISQQERYKIEKEKLDKEKAEFEKRFMDYLEEKEMHALELNIAKEAREGNRLLQQHLYDKREHLDQWQSELDEKQSQIDKELAQLDAGWKKLEKQVNKLAAAKKQIDAEKAEIERNKIIKDELEKSMHLMQEPLERVANEVAAVSQQALLNEIKLSTGVEQADLETIQEYFRKDLAVLKHRNAELEEKTSKLEDENSRLKLKYQHDIKELNARLEEAANDSAEYKQGVVSLQEKVSEIQKSLKEQNEINSSLQKQLMQEKLKRERGEVGMRKILIGQKLQEEAQQRQNRRAVKSAVSIKLEGYEQKTKELVEQARQEERAKTAAIIEKANASKAALKKRYEDKIIAIKSQMEQQFQVEFDQAQAQIKEHYRAKIAKMKAGKQHAKHK